jgi:hypothetical protein
MNRVPFWQRETSGGLDATLARFEEALKPSAPLPLPDDIQHPVFLSPSTAFVDAVRRLQAKQAGIEPPAAPVERPPVALPPVLSAYALTVVDGSALGTKTGGLLAKGVTLFLPGPPREAFEGDAFALHPTPGAAARHPTVEELGKLAPAIAVCAEPASPCADDDGIARRREAGARALADVALPSRPAFGGAATDATTAAERGVLDYLVRALALPDADALEVARQAFATSAVPVPGVGKSCAPWSMSAERLAEIAAELRAPGGGTWGPDEVGRLVDEEHADHERAVAAAHAEQARRRDARTRVVRVTLREAGLWAYSLGTVWPMFLAGLFAAARPEPDLVLEDGRKLFLHPAVIPELPCPDRDGFVSWDTTIEISQLKLTALQASPAWNPGFVDSLIEAAHAAGLIDRRRLEVSELFGHDTPHDSAMLRALTPLFTAFAREYIKSPQYRRPLLLQSTASWCVRACLRFPAVVAKELCAAVSKWRVPSAMASDLHAVFPVIDDLWYLRGFEEQIERACEGAALGHVELSLHTPGVGLADLAALAEELEEREAEPLAAGDGDPWRDILSRSANGRPMTNAELLLVLERAGEKAPDVPNVRKRIFAIMSTLGYEKTHCTIDGVRKRAFRKQESRT